MAAPDVGALTAPRGCRRPTRRFGGACRAVAETSGQAPSVRPGALRVGFSGSFVPKNIRDAGSSAGTKLRVSDLDPLAGKKIGAVESGSDGSAPA
jgi:hypothetical protein